MRRSYLFLTFAACSAAALALQGCNKENGIDNETVVTRPYSLYVADNQGSLFNTNNGETFNIVFPPDGVIPRSIVTSKKNLLWIKQNVHLSEDNGLNFNPTYTSARPQAFWQSMALNVPGHNRVYVASTEGNGVVFSEDNGKTWKVDDQWDAGISGVSINSFTQLQNGMLFAHDLMNQGLYKRNGAAGLWSQVTMNGLPNAAFYLSHFGNTLVLSDYLGTNGVWYSTDEGQNWQQYTDLPVGQEIYATYAPFDQTLLVGLDSLGLYRLQGTQFVPANSGLETTTSVRAIVDKDDVYKNGAVKRYVYIATTQGLYRSYDMGVNWTLMKPGSFSAIY